MEALAVGRRRMGPEGAAELDPWRDFDFCRSGGQCSELIADRLVGLIFGQRRDAVETGNVEQAPKQAGEPGDCNLARPVVAPVFFGLLRVRLRRPAQYFDVSPRRIGAAVTGWDTAAPMVALVGAPRGIGGGM